MALVVEQRPEEELFVEENPTVYDTPYFTSRWNAANLPLVYKISNTKFPVNTEDTIETILGVSNVGGFAQFTLDTTTFTFVNKGTVKVTNTTNYNGIWSIREVVDSENIIINAPFIATEEGNVQNYFNNYNTLVKVYSGLPEYHPLNSINPMTLITDNPITITPNSDNEAVIDVAALIKSKINLDNDYELNDLNLFTALYIEYSEQYDESDGTTVSTTTEAYATDLIAGCDSGAANFVSNGDFSSGLTDWTQNFQGQTWSEVTGLAQVTLTNNFRFSTKLKQSSLGLSNDVEYNLSFDYNVGAENVTIYVTQQSVIYEAILTGSGTINTSFFTDGSNEIGFEYALNSSIVSDLDCTLDNVSIVNVLTNPCIAYTFATHSAQQPQYKYGGNMGEYVQNFNGGQFANKWLTLFDKPVLFKDNYFDISTIIPQNVIQSAIQAGGFFLELIEFDKNGVAIEENQYPITQNLGDGVYRFRLDDKDFNANTKEFTVQILRIPVNLFVDGDQGTFDTTSDITGNPPSDWNLEKDSRAIINFDNTLSFEGAASLKFESRSIFNDDYALYGIKWRDQSPNEIRFFDSQPLTNLSYFNNDFSIELRCYVNTQDKDNNSIIGRNFNSIYGFTTTNVSFLRIGFNWSPFVGRIQWRSINNINVNQNLTFNSFEFDTWYHLVLTFEKGVVAKLYINGLEEDSTTSNVDITNADNIETVVTNGVLDVSDGSDSYIRGIRHYDKALSAAEVTSLYNNNPKNIQDVPVGLIPNLKREYLYNQEQGRNTKENENGLDGTLSDDYTNNDVSFGGGAWVDVSAIN